MVYLKTFKLNDYRNIDRNIYPFNVLEGKEPDVFVFDDITVLYGNNGSGKSTILNIIAHKLNIKGKEKSNPDVTGMKPYFEDYAVKCEYTLETDEYGFKRKIPENSRYIKSEEILYEIRKIQQKAVLEEAFISDNIKKGKKIDSVKNLVNTYNGQKLLDNIKFAQEKYSNGETTLNILSNSIEPDCLYLLDEPEVSLSPQKQVELAKELNNLKRYLGVQLIIATHSPFMLGILEAKIYNLDTKNFDVQKWSELDNTKFFYEFFKSRKDEFKN